jgi:hypothetical protein
MIKAAKNLPGYFDRHSGRPSFKASAPPPPPGRQRNSAGLLAGR